MGHSIVQARQYECTVGLEDLHANQQFDRALDDNAFFYFCHESLPLLSKTENQTSENLFGESRMRHLKMP